MTDREQFELFRTIVERLPEALFRTDTKGNFMWVSQAAVELMGYKDASEVIGTPAIEFYVHPTARHRLMRRVLAEGVVRNFITSMKRKNADPWYAELSCVGLEDAEGKPAGIMGVCRDVTQHLQLVDNLHALREFNETVLNTIPSAIVSVDVHGQITLANDAACHVSQCRREDLLDKNVLQEAPGWILERRQDVRDVLRTGIFKVASGIPYHDPEGTTRFLDITILPFHHEGEIAGVIIEASDVTDHIMLARRAQQE